MEYTFTWIIENYSYNWQNIEDELKSPKFSATGLESTAWFLSLYPRGHSIEHKGWISIFLERRYDDDEGPEDIYLKYELSFLGVDGSAFISEDTDWTFRKGENDGHDKFLEVHELFSQLKATYLHPDTLTVRCRMRIEEGTVQNIEQGTARTRFGIEHISFLHVVEGFSTLETIQNQISQIKSSTKDTFVTSSIRLADSSCCVGKIILEINPSKKEHHLTKCNLFLLGASGIVIKCGGEDNRFGDIIKDIQQLPLSLTRKSILCRNSEYLPDDKLTLLCVCTFSTGVECKKIEKTLHEIPSFAFNQVHNGRSNVEKKLSACSSLVDDLKALYTTQLLADVEVKTKTKSFRAHKNLLCARSSIFKSMLTNDMKEKKTDCIQLHDDLENDTVEKLLHFLYTDELKMLELDSAIKLYYAADKYRIEKLKLECSAVLLDNLSTSNVVELLAFANQHSDSDLQSSVCDFILKYEEVFCSDEWEEFMKENPVLASETMRLKYVPNNSF